MSAAKKLAVVRTSIDGRERAADEKLILHGNPRAIAVAKFRELADKLESGELDGARCQWRSESPELQFVTLDNNTVQIVTFTIEEV